MTDRMPESMPNETPDRMSEDLPNRLPDRMSEDMPDRMSEDIRDRMSDRMSEEFRRYAYMALFLAVEVRLRSGEAYSAQNLAG